MDTVSGDLISIYSYFFNITGYSILQNSFFVLFII